ncbi:tRNA lysidine(34) synthetase TilS [Candidatus Saccharibacteria bacterium]|nr:tRNA lysidine(34) synthetase TilS [Candidatus Saccharibacteria bacterium]
MKYVIAVSGGVDSVVLLDMFAKSNDDLVVAHFDHGIRADSHLDAQFVKSLAEKYGLPFETRRENLGPDASEDVARKHRYKFLREVAGKYGAKLVTAHHSDDVIETIAINLKRGTGWRGLAVLDSDVLRPLSHMTKYEIIEYARKHKLPWREDSTNASDKYLRNRIRRLSINMDIDKKRQLLALWSTGKDLKKMIDEEVRALVGSGPDYSRYFFIHVPDAVALEVLRHVINAKLTRPQLVKLLHAIKTAGNGSKYHAGGGINTSFTTRNFTVELIK